MSLLGLVTKGNSFYTSNIMKGNQEFPGLQIYKHITELSQICKNLQVEFTNGLT